MPREFYFNAYATGEAFQKEQAQALKELREGIEAYKDGMQLRIETESSVSYITHNSAYFGELAGTQELHDIFDEVCNEKKLQEDLLISLLQFRHLLPRAEQKEAGELFEPIRQSLAALQEAYEHMLYTCPELSGHLDL